MGKWTKNKKGQWQQNVSPPSQCQQPSKKLAKVVGKGKEARASRKPLSKVQGQGKMAEAKPAAKQASKKVKGDLGKGKLTAQAKRAANFKDVAKGKIHKKLKKQDNKGKGKKS